MIITDEIASNWKCGNKFKVIVGCIIFSPLLLLIGFAYLVFILIFIFILTIKAIIGTPCIPYKYFIEDLPFKRTMKEYWDFVTRGV